MLRSALRNLEDRNFFLRNLTDIFSDVDTDTFSDANFTSILAKYTPPGNTEPPNFADADTERLLKNYRVENVACFDRFFKYNKDMLKKLFDRRYTLEDLKESLKAVIPSLYLNDLTLEHFLRPIEQCPERVRYFVDKGLLEKDAIACALALSFYTGLPGTSIQGEVIDRMHRDVRFNRLANERETSSHSLVIVSFLYRALSCIPTYSGSCIRAVDLTDEEKELYEPGSIINWGNFSSSSKGDQPAAPFIEKNTYFIIQSMNGRPIVQFSNFPGENEVLFHPCSTFFVVKKEIRDGKTVIYLRQTELGLSDTTILWVDDKISNENWEHKPLYDELCGQAHQYGIRIIPKRSTAQAQSFLKSPFGKFNLVSSRNFQVVTSMRRLNEKRGKQAGLELAKWLKNNHYNIDLAVLGYYGNGSLNPLASQENTGDYAIIKNSSELKPYIQDKIKTKDKIWNSAMDDENTYNEQTPNQGGSENQTPGGGEISNTPTPETEVLHHQTLMGENPTPCDSININNLSMTPAGIDSELNTPGSLDCSQEAARRLLVDEQQTGGEPSSNYSNFNFTWMKDLVF